MIGHILRRLVSAVLVVIATSMIVFLLFTFGPADPAEQLCSADKCTENGAR